MMFEKEMLRKHVDMKLKNFLTFKLTFLEVTHYITF